MTGRQTCTRGTVALLLATVATSPLARPAPGPLHQSFNVTLEAPDPTFIRCTGETRAHSLTPPTNADTYTERVRGQYGEGRQKGAGLGEKRGGPVRPRLGGIYQSPASIVAQVSAQTRPPLLCLLRMKCPMGLDEFVFPWWRIVSNRWGEGHVSRRETTYVFPRCFGPA
jgi:hypothetical protein